MKMERLISCFDKESEELLQEYNIDYIDLSVLKSIFNPPAIDPLMYNPYDISFKEAEALGPHIKFEIKFDFDKNLYQIDCFQA